MHSLWLQAHQRKTRQNKIKVGFELFSTLLVQNQAAGSKIFCVISHFHILRITVACTHSKGKHIKLIYCLLISRQFQTETNEGLYKHMPSFLESMSFIPITTNGITNHTLLDNLRKGRRNEKRSKRDWLLICTASDRKQLLPIKYRSLLKLPGLKGTRPCTNYLTSLCSPPPVCSSRAGEQRCQLPTGRCTL